MMKYIQYLLIVSLVLFNVHRANAMVVVCPTCSSLVTQLVEKATSLQAYAETIKHTFNQVEMIRNEVQQYENMIKNTQGLSLKDINDVKSLLGGLQTVNGRLEVMRADVNMVKDVYSNIYPDFLELTEFGEKEEEMFDEMSKRVDKATLATFQVTASQLEEMKESGAFDEHIDSLLETPEGQMQALSSANHLSSLQLQESRLLRETVLIQAQAEATLQAREEKERQAKASLIRQFVNTPDDRNYTPNVDPF